jgi:hypothetical protein
MSDSIEQQAEQMRWAADVKVLLDNLNDYLARPPEGLDLKVTVNEINTKVGALAGPDDRNMVWKIQIGATRTHTIL